MKKVDLNSIMSPGEIVAGIVVFAGLLLAIFVDSTAVRLLGIVLSLLGLAGVFWLMSNRGNGDAGKAKPKILVKLDEFVAKFSKDKKEGTSDFVKAFGGPDDDVNGKKQPKVKFYEKNQLDDVPDEFAESDSDGFRVIPKGTDTKGATNGQKPAGNGKNSGKKPSVQAAAQKNQETKKVIPSQPAVKPPEVQSAEVKPPVSVKPPAKLPEQIFIDEFEFEEEESGMRIVPKEELQQKEGPAQTPETRPAKANNLPEPPQAAVFAGESTGSDDVPVKAPEKEEKSDGSAVQLKLDEEIVQQVIEDEIIENTEFNKQYKKKQIDIPITMLMEEEPYNTKETREEFDYFLLRVLKGIRTYTKAKTAAFLLVNKTKKELILEITDSDIEESLIPKRKITIRNDVLSQIARTAKPEILTEINPTAELEIIPYYQEFVGTNSFIGVPVFYNKSVVGILCADTDKPDAYDVDTIRFFSQFTKLISAIIQNYTDKYDLLQSSRTLDAIKLFRRIMSNQKMSIEDIHISLVESATKLFEYNTAGICTYDEDGGTWTVKNLRKTDEESKIVDGSKIDIDKTLLGEAIINCRTVFRSPLEKTDTRINAVEPKMAGGYFLAVPIRSFVNNYGSIFLEGDNNCTFTEYDREILETLGEHAGTSIEQMYFIEMLQSSSLMDNSTGMYNPPAFYSRLDEEIARAQVYSTAASLCLFTIDKYVAFESEDNEETTEQIIYQVLNVIARHLRRFDIIGRIDSETFAVLLPGMKINQGQLWAEKLRSDVAQTVIELHSKRFNVTISIGLAKIGSSDNVNELMANCRHVLGLAQKQSNVVQIFG